MPGDSLSRANRGYPEAKPSVRIARKNMARSRENEKEGLRTGEGTRAQTRGEIPAGDRQIPARFAELSESLGARHSAWRRPVRLSARRGAQTGHRRTTSPLRQVRTGLARKRVQPAPERPPVVVPRMLP